MQIKPWLDGFTRVDLDLTGVAAPEVGRPYDETSHPKICLHTTEGATLEGAERAFAAYPPHIGVRFATRQRHQYLPLDRCSFSLRGSESDDELVIQVEVQGYASKPPGREECDWLGREVIAPIASATGCPLVAVQQGFHGPGEGIVLASTSSPIRFRTEAELRAFSGVMGHQHAPPPDEHWDPGAIDIGRILAAARHQEDDMSAEDVRQINAHTNAVVAAAVAKLVGDQDTPGATLTRIGQVLHQNTDGLMAAVKGIDVDLDAADVAAIAAGLAEKLPPLQAQSLVELLLDQLPPEVAKAIGQKLTAPAAGS